CRGDWASTRRSNRSSGKRSESTGHRYRSWSGNHGSTRHGWRGWFHPRRRRARPARKPAASGTRVFRSAGTEPFHLRKGAPFIAHFAPFLQILLISFWNSIGYIIRILAIPGPGLGLDKGSSVVIETGCFSAA